MKAQDQICFHANLYDSLNDENKKARLVDISESNILSTSRHKTIKGHSKPNRTFPSVSAVKRSTK